MAAVAFLGAKVTLKLEQLLATVPGCCVLSGFSTITPTAKASRSRRVKVLSLRFNPSFCSLYRSRASLIWASLRGVSCHRLLPLGAGTEAPFGILAEAKRGYLAHFLIL